MGVSQRAQEMDHDINLDALDAAKEDFRGHLLIWGSDLKSPDPFLKLKYKFRWVVLEIFILPKLII